jgi:opacity protein-like surface antigen
MKSLYLTSVTLLLLTQTLFAQQAKWEIGISAGMSPYLGDINKQIVYVPSQSGFGAQLHAKYNFKPSFALRAAAAYMTLKGDDKNFSTPDWRTKRGFSFTNTLMEGSLCLEYDILAKSRERKGNTSAKLSPYLVLGGAVAFHDPKATFNEPNIVATAVVISEDKAAVGKMTSFAIPLGAGLHYAINPKWSLGLEVTSRVSKSDYLDGISKAGNPNKNDWYALSSLSIIHKFGLKEAKAEKIDMDKVFKTENTH